MNVFGNQLTDKRIMLEDGTELGEVYNVRINTKTGSINTLLMQRDEPKSARDDRASGVPFPQEQETGLYTIPAGNVRAIQDHIIVGL